MSLQIRLTSNLFVDGEPAALVELEADNAEAARALVGELAEMLGLSLMRVVAEGTGRRSAPPHEKAEPAPDWQDTSGEKRTCDACRKEQPIEHFRPFGRGRKKTCESCGAETCPDCRRNFADMPTPKRQICGKCSRAICSACWGPHDCEEGADL